MATGAAIATLAATAVSYEEGQRERRAGKRARKAASRRAAIQRARERRKAQAQKARARARLRAETAASGAAGSSAAAGAESSISAQAAERLGFSGFTEQVGEQIQGFEAKAASARGRAATAQAIGSVPRQVGLEPSFASLFDSDDTGTTT